MLRAPVRALFGSLLVPPDVVFLMFGWNFRDTARQGGCERPSCMQSTGRTPAWSRPAQNCKASVWIRSRHRERHPPECRGEAIRLHMLHWC